MQRLRWIRRASGLGLRGLVLGLGLVAPLCAQALDLVVMDAAGAPYRPGDIVASAAPITLAPGQSLRLIAPSGQIVTLSGPHEAPPLPQAKEQDATVLASLKGLVAERTSNTSSLGVTRDLRAGPPNPWVVDVNGSGTRCLREGEPVIFWRTDATQALPCTLTTRDGEWVAKATWPAGNQQLVAPGSLPVTTGETLEVAFPRGQATLTLSVLPRALPSDAARLAWMLEAGCTDQAAALSKTLP